MLHINLSHLKRNTTFIYFFHFFLVSSFNFIGQVALSRKINEITFKRFSNNYQIEMIICIYVESNKYTICLFFSIYMYILHEHNKVTTIKDR